MPSIQADRPVSGRAPLYAVVFHATPDDAPFQPVLTEAIGSDSFVTVPHGLDREVATALTALWYCLHLPSTFGDFVDLPASNLKADQTLHLDHHIRLAPVDLFHDTGVDWPRRHEVPVLALCPDDALDEVAARCET
jgi:hypothetical protein